MNVRERHNPTDVKKLYIDGTQVTSTATELNKLDGASAYVLGYPTAGYTVVAASTAVTGSVVVDVSSNLSSVVSATANLRTAPGATAGDPFLVRANWSGTDVTFTVYQDDATAAATAGSINYMVVGVGV